MKHPDHVNLIKGGIPISGGLWADFGSGTGAFTLALADCLGPSAQIISIDRDGAALREQRHNLNDHFPAAKVEYLQADFVRPLDLPLLDGIVMANALHFHRDKRPILNQVCAYLKPGGRFILVEYNVDKGNTWVPYPISYPGWQSLAPEGGFTETQFLAKVPSRFLGEIYSALSFAPHTTGKRIDY